MTNLHTGPGLAAHEGNTTKRRQENRTRGQLSLFSMELALLTLGVASVGAAKLAWDVFSRDTVTALGERFVFLAAAFLLGWVFCLVSIRVLGNLLLPVLLRFYALLVSGGILVVYARVAVKMFNNTYDPASHRPLYIAILLIGFGVIAVISLLLDETDLRPLSIPLLAAAVVHIFAGVWYYIVLFNEPHNTLDHLLFSVLMLTLAGLMLVHFGLLMPLRTFINTVFSRAENDLKPE